MKKKITEEKNKVAVINNTASESTTNKEAYENSKNKLTENLKNHLWDNSREEMERYLIGIAHPEFTLVERSSVDDRSLGYIRSIFSMKQEDSINLLSNRA